jgi:hypothetical protein
MDAFSCVSLAAGQKKGVRALSKEKAPSGVQSLGPFQANHRGNRRVLVRELGRTSVTDHEAGADLFSMGATGPYRNPSKKPLRNHRFLLSFISALFLS